jgi:hypothetical protein
VFRFPPQKLASCNWHIFRGIDTDFDVPAIGLDDVNHDVLTDLERLAAFSRDDQHFCILHVAWLSPLDNEPRGSLTDYRQDARLPEPAAVESNHGYHQSAGSDQQSIVVRMSSIRFEGVVAKSRLKPQYLRFILWRQLIGLLHGIPLCWLMVIEPDLAGTRRAGVEPA